MSHDSAAKMKIKVPHQAVFNLLSFTNRKFADTEVTYNAPDCILLKYFFLNLAFVKIMN